MDGPHDSHYFAQSPSVESRPDEIRLTLPDLTVDLTVDRGVFSASHVDPGTRYLLMTAPMPPPQQPSVDAAHLLDLGCGYGPIAVALAMRAPEATIWAIDVNERARDLCATNAERAGVADRVMVCEPDGVPAEIRFAGIWSNPPIRIGKPRLRELLTRWLTRMTPEAHAYLVVGRNLGADSLQRWLSENGWETTRLGSHGGYRLLDVSGPRR